MKKELVRCWKVGEMGRLYITYPEGDKGHRLIFCVNCGCVHSVNVAKQMYMGPDLDSYLSGVLCYSCGSVLKSNWYFYPDRFLEDGCVKKFKRCPRVPDESGSIIVEFPEVFS
tara:strand:+ start:113 stop:451 length:339 start_codon:yes stop_codon:yes gene_type:complete